MHIIGFSHHYTKLNGEKCGVLLSVRSTKNIRPTDWGMHFDTEYTDIGIRYNKHSLDQ